MGSIISGVTDAIGLTDTKDAGDKSWKAAQLTAGAQEESLAYLKEREALPQAYREAALKGLGGEYGFTLDQEGNVISDGRSIDQRVMSDPRYLNARDRGSEAIMREASMTGGMRSGNTQDALYRADAALYDQAYGNQIQGMQGFANLPSNANQIASGISGIGRTLGQGRIAQGQSNVASQNQLFGDVMGIGSLALGAMGAGLFGGGAGAGAGGGSLPGQFMPAPMI